MNCANCGKIVRDNSFSEDEYFFCNALCRYEWRKNGKPNPFASTNGKEVYDDVANIDLNFPIDPAGFENRNLIICPSYWAFPKLFLDGEKLTPIKKNWFTRRSDYSAVSNFGKDVTITLRYRALDSIPLLYIDGQKFQIARPLTNWEYLWICLPIVLIFIGGIIGAILGTSAIFSNAILIRKIKNIPLRYIYTGGTTLMAILLFIKFIGFANPYLLNISASIDLDSTLKQNAKQINIACPIFVDDETRLDSANVPQEKTFSYYYTLVNRTKNDINVESFISILKPQLIHNVQTQNDMLFIRENDVTLEYNYFDKRGEKIIELPVTPADYK